MAHAAFSEKQLQELMGAFWSNHFHAVTKGTRMYVQNIDDHAFYRENAFGRFAPDIRSEALFVALEGKQFEVLAKSEAEEPVWYFGKNEQGVEGWMAELVLDCEEIDPKQLLPREAPDFKIPEEKPDGEPLTCKPDLPNREICEEAGGTWVIVNTRANGDYCDCSLK